MQTVKAENPPDLALRGDERSPSHLTTLMNRVREDEEQFNCATKEHLINLAEYILTWPGKYSDAEYDEAIKILANYHLAPLACKVKGLGWELIEKELALPYTHRCRRCGMPITNLLSVETGHGPVCRKKLGIKAGEK
jgi:hypothetical protein